MGAVNQHKVELTEDEMPTRWYNVLHDLPTPPPPVLHPGTGQPVGPDDLAPLFPTGIPLVYRLDENMRPLERGGRYLDPAAAEEAIKAVAAQGR